MTDFMEIAFAEARKALLAGEVPVGCVFVYTDEIIAKGHNQVNKMMNAIRHAEMECIDEALKWCQTRGIDFRTVFASVHIYVTVEPCGMCIDALRRLNVMNITYGCSNDRFGGCGSIVDVPTLYNYGATITKGIRAEEAVNLLKQFYGGTNLRAPPTKRKKSK